MLSSVPPLAEASACHPVHRVTTLLREALYGPAKPAPDPAEICDEPLFSLDPAPFDLAFGPIDIAQPESFSAFLARTPSALRGNDRQSPVTEPDDGSAPRASVEEASEGDEMLDQAGQRQLEGLVQAFHRRQRQVSLLVAGSIAAAVLITLCGLVLMFSMNGPIPAEDAGAKDATSLALASSAEGPSSLAPTQVRANRAAKASSLLLRAKATEPSFVGGTPDTQIVLAPPARPLALGPLLPLGSARYVLLRGLPEMAVLSAGHRTGAGAWMVKGEDVDDLTLTLGAEARGDYAVEAYLLGAHDGPQPPRRLIFRADGSPKVYAAGLALGWPLGRSAAASPAPSPEAKPEPAKASPAPIDTDALRKQAQALLGRGDIAGARLLLTKLAERGQADAAYELALTYDEEVLTKAGLQNIEGDSDTARNWYAQAAKGGHGEAAKRLELLAKSRGGA